MRVWVNVLEDHYFFFFFLIQNLGSLKEEKISKAKCDSAASAVFTPTLP